MNLLFKNIIYFVILILSISFIITLLSQQRVYLCLDNLEKTKNIIEKAISRIEDYHSNIILKIEMPQDFEYSIYSDGKNIYIYDLSCNIKSKINKNITLIGEIHSKKFFYIIKNDTNIYLSPKELDISPGLKEESMPIYSIQSPPQGSPTPISQIQTNQQTENIFLIFIRSRKYGGALISNSNLRLYAQISTEHLKKAFTDSFSNFYPFNFSDSYKYYVIEDRYIDISIEDCFTDYISCQKAFSVFSDICNNIKNAYAIIFVILVNDSSLKYGGLSFLSSIIKDSFYYVLRHNSRCEAKILTFLEINMAYARPSTLAHEVGHALANLYDQYLNGCNSYYWIDLNENKIIDFVKYLEKEGGIICNKLDKNSGAKISDLLSTKIDEIYKKYNISTIIDKEYLKNEICFGENAIILYNDLSYIIIEIYKKPDIYKYDLSKECKIILINESSGKIDYGDCYSIITKYNLNLDIYNDQISLISKVSPIGLCVGNIDIFGVNRDIMYGFGSVQYFSSTSIYAFKNNINKIWS